MTIRTSIERLADDAPVPHTGPHHSPAMDRACAALEAQAARTVRAIIKDRARAYALAPSRLSMLIPGLSLLSPRRMVERLADTRRFRPRRWYGFGGEVPSLNLRGALLYARYHRAQERKRARRAA